MTKIEVFLALHCWLNWDSKQGRDRKTSILLFEDLKYPRNSRLHSTLILNLVKPLIYIHTTNFISGVAYILNRAHFYPFFWSHVLGEGEKRKRFKCNAPHKARRPFTRVRSSETSRLWWLLPSHWWSLSLLGLFIFPVYLRSFFIVECNYLFGNFTHLFLLSCLTGVFKAK